MDLNSLRRATPGLSEQSHADKIRLFGWYLHTEKRINYFQPADVGNCYDALHIGRPSSFSGYFANLVSAKELLKSSSGYRLENRVRETIDKKYRSRPATVQVAELLRSLPEKIPNLAEQTYLDEALRCFEAEAFRAS